MKAVKIVLTILLLAMMVIPMVNAQVAVSSFNLNPQSVLPGSEVNIDITIENVGEEDIEDVIVTLDLSEVPFVPAGSSNEKIIDEINDGDEERVTFQVKALSDAQPSTYKIPVVISYAGASKTS